MEWGLFVILATPVHSPANYASYGHPYSSTILVSLTKRIRMMMDDELFMQNGGPTKGVKPYFQPRSLSKNLIIENLRHAASRS